MASMTDKHAYGIAFGMYAVRNVYEATERPGRPRPGAEGVPLAG